MKNDMPETIFVHRSENTRSDNGEPNPDFLWLSYEQADEGYEPYTQYTHVEKLIARIEAMKREPDEDNCRFQRHWDAEVLECQIHNAALSAVIDMLGQKEG